MLFINDHLNAFPIPMKHVNFFIAIVLLLILSSCNAYNERKKVVENMLGKEILIPEGMTCQIQDTPFEYDFEFADFKILTYIDSTECTSCNMKLPYWNDVLDEFKAIDEFGVNFLMIISSKEKPEISRLLRMSDFKHPIVVDDEGKFSKLNKLPKGAAYRTFLLDENNMILALGNPATNPKIKNLYKKIIAETRGEMELDQFSLVTEPIKNLGMIGERDTVNVSFYMRNNDSIPYHIQGIIPSCNCITVENDSYILSPGTTNKIGIQFVADSIGSRMYKYIDIFYEEKEYPERLIVYGYLKSPSIN